MTTYFWCLAHRQVEPEGERCASANALGPYPTADDAAHALDRVAERNDEWDDDDKRWEGDTKA